MFIVASFRLCVSVRDAEIIPHSGVALPFASYGRVTRLRVRMAGYFFCNSFIMSSASLQPWAAALRYQRTASA